MSGKMIAALALGVSLLVAGWNVVQYLLLGPRVRIRLRPGLLTDYRLGWAPKWSRLCPRIEQEGGWPLEVAVVDIENRGRQPVTVYATSLYVRKRWWWVRRRRRWTLRPRPLEAPGATTEDRVRLEPYDHRRVVFDVWAVLRSERGVHEDAAGGLPGRVRASVQVAGRRRARLSPWWRGWRIRSGQVAFCEPVEVGLAAHRAVSRHSQGDDDMRMHTIPIALKVRERFPYSGPAPSKEDVAGVIEDVWVLPDKQPTAAALVAYYVAEDLSPFYKSNGE